MGFPPGLLHPSGALLVDDSGLISQSPGITAFAYANGLKLNNAGQLVLKQDAPVHTYNNGLPVTANGELIVTYGAQSAGVSTLDLDFVAMARVRVLDPRLTFFRTSQAWGFDQTGTLVNYPGTTVRWAYDINTLEPLGVYIELSSTNTVPNNTMVGASPGAPGTQPNLWNMDGDGNGLFRTIMGTGQEDGIDYIDVRYTGIPVAATPISVAYTTLGQVNSSPAQLQGMSAFYRLMAGSTGGLTFTQCISASDGVAYLGDSISSVPFTPGTGKLRTQRVFATGNTNTFPGTTKTVNRLRVDVTPGRVVDFVIRIGLPQNDSSGILSTPIKTTAAATGRTAENISMTGANFTDWYTQGPGTILAEYMAALLTTGTVYEVNAGAPNLIRQRIGTAVDAGVTVGSVIQGTSQILLPVGRTAETITKSAAAWSASDVQAIANGMAGTLVPVAAIPLALTTLNIGTANAGASGIGGIFRRLIYFPQRLGTGIIQAVTENTFWVGGVLVSNSAVRIVRA